MIEKDIFIKLFVMARMIYCDGKALYIGTDRRKSLFSEMMENPYVSIGKL